MKSAVKSLKILIIRNDKIGDLVLTTPIFREIKRFLPQSHITLIVSKSAKPIVEKNRHIDRLITLNHFNGRKSLKGYLKLSKWIRIENFDIGFDMRGSRMNCLFFLWLPKIKKRVSFSNLHNLSFFLNKNIVFDNIYDNHLTRESLEIINRGLKINAENNFPEIFTDDMDEEETKVFITKNNLKNYICLCPGGNYGKWKYFKEIIEHISKKYPSYHIVLCGGSEDIPEIERLYKCSNKCVKAINFNLRVVYLLFKKSKLVIAPDGGPMHIAGASRANLIALFGRTSPNHQMPLGKNSITLSPPGLLEYIKRYKRVPQDKNGINLISASEVKEYVDKLLDEN